MLGYHVESKINIPFSANHEIHLSMLCVFILVLFASCENLVVEINASISPYNQFCYINPYLLCSHILVFFHVHLISLEIELRNCQRVCESMRKHVLVIEHKNDIFLKVLFYSWKCWMLMWVQRMKETTTQTPQCRRNQKLILIVSLPSSVCSS